MITADILKANEHLAKLTDEQISSIVTLSTNDVNAEIGKKIGELYRQLDTTIDTSTGIARNGDEKTYNYLERAIKELKGGMPNVDDMKGKIKTLTEEKTRLEALISEGSKDTETAKLLNQAKAELKSTKDLYIGLQTKFDEQAKTHKTELFGLRVENELTNALNGLKFKAEIPANVTKTFVNAAISKVKGLNPDYVDDVNGGKRLVFRDSNGVAISNPTNLAPYTAAELLGNELKDIIAIKGAKGTGTQVDGGGSNNDTVTIGNARTQQEAMTIISKSLCAQGLTAGSKEYQTKLDAAWAENKVKSLPVK
mgnify:FL=1